MASQGNIQPAKLVLLGDMGAGKSSLVLRFVKGQFTDYQVRHDNTSVPSSPLTAFLSPLLTCPSHLVQNKQTQESTIGAAFLTKTVPEFKVKFEIWDTAGQERYHSLAPMYYRGAAAAIIVYDITSTESFNRAKNWVRELQRQGNPDLIVALAGNKADLAGQRAVEPSEAQGYADENGLYFIETSAKTSVNVGDLFNEIAKRLSKPKQVAKAPGSGNVVLTRDAPAKKKQQCC